ncbi:MAG: CHAT domain-containing protein [Bryobacteraceae bacterium]|nr:CHAT domain-containing protein [Bryobacteraceae bacterium]
MAPSEFTDLEIYIRPAKCAVTADASRHDVEARINGAGLWRDEALLDEAALSPFEDQPEEYGRRLRAQVFAGRIDAAFHRALGAQAGGKVRVRLLLDAAPDRRHWFRWERLFAGSEPLSTSASTPFSRYLLGECTAPVIPDDGVFHLVVAVANPLPSRLPPVDVNAELRALVLAFRALGNRALFKLVILPGGAKLDPGLAAELDELHARIVPGPVTFEAIKLETQSSDGLHIISHGKFDRARQTGYLFLEDANGQVDRIDDDRLRTWNNGSLKLVYLQACESAARANDPSMVGVAAHLVAAGVPAVVAMQQPVEMNDARLMSRAFYQSLVRDGAVDVAVNAGRQAVQAAGGDRWSVPALYMSLRDGRLWHADPFREALRQAVAGWEAKHDMQTPVPLQATKDKPGGSYDVTALSVAQLKADGTRLLVLAGARGTGKTAVLDRVAWTLGKEFLEGQDASDDGYPLPVRFDLAELAGHADLLAPLADRLRPRDGLQELLRQRPIVLLVDAEDDVVPARRADFVRALARLPANVKVMLSVDILALDDWMLNEVHGGLRQPVILRMEPMERALVMRYLQDLEKNLLAEKIQRNRWWDLTSQSWMLRRMIRYEEAGLKNRAQLFERITAEQIGRLPLGNVTPSCAGQALATIAWELQQTQEASLAGGALYELLAHARRGRDFPLGEIKTALIDDCQMLRRSGEDGVRFSYEGFQAYYAALYLMQAPDRERQLDAIIATLGSTRHLRLWDEPLVILAGLMDFGPVLARMLASSSASTGEQVYLAAKCYLEIPASRRTDALQHLGGLLVDTLIWRSHPKNERPIVERKRAIRWLTEMDSGLPPEEDRALPHLVELACDPIAKGWDGQSRYEFSGLRLEAMNVLLARREAVTRYVAARRPQLAPLLGASGKLLDHHDAAPMVHVLNRNNPNESPLAVFALGLSGRRDVLDILIAANQRPELNVEVRWAIAEMLPRLDPEVTLARAIRPYLDAPPESRIVYMINKVGRDGADTNAYLERALQSGKPRVVGRALRTLADLGQQAMKTPGELIVQGDWAGLHATGRVQLKASPAFDEQQSLQHAALEGLRTVGDEATLAVLQTAWLKLSPILSQLSHDVAEHIYWRLRSK